MGNVSVFKKKRKKHSFKFVLLNMVRVTRQHNAVQSSPARGSSVSRTNVMNSASSFFSLTIFPSSRQAALQSLRSSQLSLLKAVVVSILRCVCCSADLDLHRLNLTFLPHQALSECFATSLQVTASLSCSSLPSLSLVSLFYL